jgi:hypothetical protein
LFAFDFFLAFTLLPFSVEKHGHTFEVFLEMKRSIVFAQQRLLEHFLSCRLRHTRIQPIIHVTVYHDIYGADVQFRSLELMFWNEQNALEAASHSLFASFLY